ncbi:MAG: hypothetical protein IJ636_01100 [Bacteroidales bacterium]|nr:hypothetical protein [Bacteroidales bacterium]
MAYQETTRQSYGSKVKNSFQGIFWGIILIIAGTIVLWWNEGRAVKASNALKDFQKNYVELSDITTVDPGFEGKAVHATGVATTADTLRDAAFGIAVNAMRIVRNVEYYQWTQNSESESKDKLGGSTETTTTYTYEPAWCSGPVNSNEFKDPDYRGKNFVWRTVDDNEQLARNVSFGAYRLTESIVGRISGEEPAYPALTDDQKKQLLANVTDSTVLVTVSGDQVYIGADPATPHIGDVRITFMQVTSPKTISLLQKVVNGTFEPYIAKNGKAFSKVEMGTVSAENMIEHQKSANKVTLWLLRLLGIFLVIAGFRSLVSFISTIFAVVPFVQRIIGAGTGLVATLVGLVWSFIVIAIAWIAYRPVVAIALLVAAAVLIFLLVSRSRKKKISDVAALLVILLMIGAGCTHSQAKGGDSNVASSDYNTGLKGPVKTVTVTEYYGEGEPGITVYEYDEKGKIISQEDLWEEPEESIVESLSVKDEQDRYTKKVYGTSENDIYSINFYEYDSKGNVTYSCYQDADATYHYETRNRFDAEGRLTLSTSKNPNNTYTTANEYDENGRLAKSTYTTDGSVTSFSEYRYDEKGRQIVRIENMISAGQILTEYASYDEKDEPIASTMVTSDSEGTRVTSRDTIFFDNNGMRHQRSYYHFDDEKAYESTFNKEGYVTHYEYFEDNASQPSIVADFSYAPDGQTLREISWKKMLLGQVKETQKKNFAEKVDTFGNWIRRTLGIQYNFDAQYMDFDGLTDMLCGVSRDIVYRGPDQGHNYGFTGKTEGGADLRLICTEDDDVLLGDLTIDGNTFRTVGTCDENGELYFAAVKPNGDIPWALVIPAGNGRREGTLYKGEDATKVTITPTREGLMTFVLSADVSDIVGIYEFNYPGNLRSGSLNVWRGGENYEEYHFEIMNTGSGVNKFNMAKDDFTDYIGEEPTVYRYMWNDDTEESFSYTIRFIDNFAVVRGSKGNPNAFFGLGTSIDGIYVKLPAVG